MAHSTNEENKRLAVRLIRRWALFASPPQGGNPIKELERLSGSQGEAYDRMGVMLGAAYVEGTLGFVGVRDLLVWHYVQKQAVEDYPFMGQDATMSDALLRHGLGQEMAELPVGLVCIGLHDRFVADLARRIEVEHVTPRAHPDYEAKTQGPTTANEVRQFQLLASIRRALMRGDIKYAQISYRALEKLRDEAKGIIRKNTDKKKRASRSKKTQLAA